MTSIIGYTRVPFNSSSSKYFTIAPVKQLYQADQPQNLFNLNNNVVLDQGKSTATRRPTYHRMFSREVSQHGIIELIVDKKKPTMTNKTINNRDNIIPHDNINTKDYSVILSIDLYDNHHDEDDNNNLSMIDSEASFDNLQRLMDSITKIAQEKTIYYLNIINLLKKLQLMQNQHRFMSYIDKQNEKILVYFPNTISFSVDQTYIWLKHTIGIDVNKFTQWKLSHVVFKTDYLQTISKGVKNMNDVPFDGESYFNDIHMFINHVDSLIESNGLFSHHRNQEPIV